MKRRVGAERGAADMGERSGDEGGGSRDSRERETKGARDCPGPERSNPDHRLRRPMTLEKQKGTGVMRRVCADRSPIKLVPPRGIEPRFEE